MGKFTGVLFMIGSALCLTGERWIGKETEEGILMNTDNQVSSQNR